MKEKKNTCPICFTKMIASDHSLVCPECGYRYCDHSYDNRDMYSTSHTHTPQYTTTTTQTAPRPAAAPAPNTQARPSTSAPQKPITVERNHKTGKIVRGIFIVYFLAIVIRVILQILFDLLS